MVRGQSRRINVWVTHEELLALYDAVAEHGRALETTGTPGEAHDLWPFMARVSEARDAAVPERRRKPKSADETLPPPPTEA